MPSRSSPHAISARAGEHTAPSETTPRRSRMGQAPITLSQPQSAEIGSAPWNYPRIDRVPQLVAAQASATPDGVALAMGREVVEYADLNRRANQLAHYLRQLGVGPDTLVGICIERSIDLVVGLLGILKVGAAYVPCDPSHPEERIAYTLRDAGVPLVVTRARWAASLSPSAARMVCLDADAPTLDQQDRRDPDSTLSTDHLAYVIYTSGSTGRPKGVQITHGGLLNLICWHQDAFAVTSADRATQLASPAFDATGWEVWPYLTCGASMHLPEDDLIAQPARLRDWLVEQCITISFMPTALAERMIALDWPQGTALRFLLTGADTLQRYPPQGLPFTLVNNYGPTEVTVLCTSGPVPPEADADHPPTIGRPIASTQVYILDQRLQPVPDGAVGELCVGGAGVARGYLNQPELDAERFLPDPFSGALGARLYRTGDLARYLPDGQIAFCGRRDDQIKIRGYRIEPNEITSVLNRHPDIQSSIVVAREDEPGEKRLVAYVVPRPKTRLTTPALQEVLSKSLPEYMIPAVFVALDELPIGPTGKVDRAALPAPTPDNLLAHEAASAPSSQVEEQLIRTVARLLRVASVDPDDNFFLLGGHSMLGAQLVVQVAEVFGVELTLRGLFEAPTVRQMANKIEALILAKIEAMTDDEAQQFLT
jgi:amino acid adenylation domain-containing protein